MVIQERQFLCCAKLLTMGCLALKVAFGLLCSPYHVRCNLNVLFILKCVLFVKKNVSYFSLGGWVATRASGMKKNVYGNIEDLVIDAKMVTSIGIIEKNSKVPRMSSGPDFQQIVLGSEGLFRFISINLFYNLYKL